MVSEIDYLAAPIFQVRVNFNKSGYMIYDMGEIPYNLVIGDLDGMLGTTLLPIHRELFSTEIEEIYSTINGML